MSQAIETAAILDYRREQDLFEQRIFARSPFGTALTAFLIFAGLAAAYVVATLLSGVTFLAFSGNQLVLPQETRAALVVSLLIATALGMQRYARLKDIEDMAQDSGSLRECLARNFAKVPRNQLYGRLSVATPIGVVVGVALSIFINLPLSRLFHPDANYIWFGICNTFLCVLFVRGLELTRTGARATREFIEKDLTIDLLRIDELSLVGRSAARTALIWFSVSAVSCLLFAGGLTTGAAIALISVCAAIGLAIFVLTMEKVHRRIKAAKTAELEQVRSRIDGLRHDVHTDASAAQRLQGLIAYETRIAAAPEWPFDQTTAMRLGASALILTVPWFGQALAQSLIEHLGRVVR